jgi:hypothetical protein
LRPARAYIALTTARSSIRRRPVKSPVLTFLAADMPATFANLGVSHRRVPCAAYAEMRDGRAARDGRDAVVRGIQRNARRAPRCSIAVKPPPRVVTVLIAHNLSLSQACGIVCNVKRFMATRTGPRQIERPMARGRNAYPQLSAPCTGHNAPGHCNGQFGPAALTWRVLNGKPLGKCPEFGAGTSYQVPQRGSLLETVS